MVNRRVLLTVGTGDKADNRSLSGHILSALHRKEYTGCARVQSVGSHADLCMVPVSRGGKFFHTRNSFFPFGKVP